MKNRKDKKAPYRVKKFSLGRQRSQERKAFLRNKKENESKTDKQGVRQILSCPCRLGRRILLR